MLVNVSTNCTKILNRYMRHGQCDCSFSLAMDPKLHLTLDWTLEPNTYFPRIDPPQHQTQSLSRMSFFDFQRIRDFISVHIKLKAIRCPHRILFFEAIQTPQDTIRQHREPKQNSAVISISKYAVSPPRPSIMFFQPSHFV